MHNLMHFFFCNRRHNDMSVASYDKMADDMWRFHERFNLLPEEGPARQLPEDLQKFRSKFMQEELDEYNQAIADNDLAKAFDALIDLVYVAMGTALLHRFPWARGWVLVHQANMKKVRAWRDDQSERGGTWDVVKPAGWTPPDLSELVGQAKDEDAHPCKYCGEALSQCALRENGNCCNNCDHGKTSEPTAMGNLSGMLPEDLRKEMLDERTRSREDEEGYF